MAKKAAFKSRHFDVVPVRLVKAALAASVQPARGAKAPSKRRASIDNEPVAPQKARRRQS